MKIMVVGGGGREHALAWAISGSPLCERIYCLPGNGGTAAIAENVAIAPDESDAIIRFITEKRIGFVVIGPEGALAAGLGDKLEEAGIRTFGPSAKAARLESSKSFTKELCRKLNIPTASFTICATRKEAQVRVENEDDWPLVIKQDGLAAGKGVVIPYSHDEALKVIDDCFEGEWVAGRGASGKGPILIEEYLTGQEMSYFALVDGKNFLTIATAQDYKSAHEGDKGPNTGGMGAVSPAPDATPELIAEIERAIIAPVIAEMVARGSPYRGVLYAGLMITESGPKLLEFNCRFGDPECQAMLRRLRSDLLPALIAARDGMIDHFDLRWNDGVSVAITLANRLYPGRHEAGGAISGLSFLAGREEIMVFHAGTDMRDGGLFAQGGRVLTVTALAPTLKEARNAAYEGARAIKWSGVWMRHDIGLRGLREKLMEAVKVDPSMLEAGLRVIRTPSPDPLIDLSCRDSGDRLTAIILHSADASGDVLERTRAWITQARNWEGEARLILVVHTLPPELEGRSRAIDGLKIVPMPKQFHDF